MTGKILTHELLKSLLDYNPDTGHFTWLVSNGRSRPAGSRAGWKCINLGYISIQINYTTYKAHRLAWFYVHGNWPKGPIDHINRQRSDNRIANLRDATPFLNAINQGIRKDNKTGVRGVHWHKASKKYRAACKNNGREWSLGYFSCLEEAATALNNFKISIGREIVS